MTKKKYNISDTDNDKYIFDDDSGEYITKKTDEYLDERGVNKSLSKEQLKKIKKEQEEIRDRSFALLDPLEQFKIVDSNIYWELLNNSNNSKASEMIKSGKWDFHLKRYKYFNEIITYDPKMLEIMEDIMLVANTNHPILLYGETGTGKELFAKSIHKVSDRRDKPYIDINAGGLPEHFLESELFGYEPGTFTGASNNGKKGLLEDANGGTVFLDEIGDIPITTQIKLLKVIENKTFYKLGGTKKIKTDVRFITATNKNLHNEIKNGHFREDLYYRISTFDFHIPPLRDRRREDKEKIIDLVLRMERENYSGIEIDSEKNISFSDDALDFVDKYIWPGNVRQFIDIISKAYYQAIRRKKEEINKFILQDCIGENLMSQYNQNSFVEKDNKTKTEINDSNKDKSYKELYTVEIFKNFKLKELLDSITKSYLIEANKYCKTEEEIGKLLGYSQQSISKKLEKYSIDI